MNFINFPSNVKSIVFDFDGVILDSVNTKTEGFEKLFSTYSKDKVRLLVEYHLQNGGVSRFEKIRYFFESIMNQSISESQINDLADEFSQITLNELSHNRYRIQEVFDFIKIHHAVYELHIVSGADESDLRQLCEVHGLVPYFQQILGSPEVKLNNLIQVIQSSQYEKDEFLMVGDSTTDSEAAEMAGIDFVFYNNEQFVTNENYLKSFYK